MKLKTRIEKIEQKIEPGKEIKIIVTKCETDPCPKCTNPDIDTIIVTKD